MAVRHRHVLFLIGAAIATMIGASLALGSIRSDLIIMFSSMLIATMATAHLLGIGVPRSFLIGIVIASGFIDIPRQLSMGGISGTAALTIAYLAGAVLLLIPLWSEIPRLNRIFPFLVFIPWAASSIVWSGYRELGLQNVLVLGGFIAVCMLSATLVRSDTTLVDALSRAMKVGSWIALGLFGLSTIIFGPNSSQIFGPRSFGLFALVILSWNLAARRYGQRGARLAVAVSIILVIASLSRLAIVAALILLIISRIHPGDSARGILRMTLAAVLSGILVWGLFSYVPVFKDRFVTGDVVSVGNSISLNTSGRRVLWRVTWRSALEAPLTGRGAGSAAAVLSLYGVEHPHNDYLRLFHDFGAFGVTLWISGLVLMVRGAWRAWNEGHADLPRYAVFHLASVLAIVALSLAMITDNPIAYVFIMIPIAVLVGISIGISHAQSIHVS